MKLVIEIPDHIYEHAKNISEDSYDEWDAMRAIAKGLLYEQRPRGEWIKEPTNSRSVDIYRCSICKASEEILKGGDMSKLRPYCRCGADMRKERG